MPPGWGFAKPSTSTTDAELVDGRQRIAAIKELGVFDPQEFYRTLPSIVIRWRTQRMGLSAGPLPLRAHGEATKGLRKIHAVPPPPAVDDSARPRQGAPL